MEIVSKQETPAANQGEVVCVATVNEARKLHKKGRVTDATLAKIEEVYAVLIVATGGGEIEGGQCR